MKYGLLLLIFTSIFIACNSNDDICVEDGTPKMLVQFKDNLGADKLVDSLYVSVEFANAHRVEIATAKVNTKEILVPLRVDESTITDFYVKTRKNGPESKIRIGYDKKLEYASPACGFRVNYFNVNSQLLQSMPVLQAQSIQNEITNESTPHLYLIF